MGKSITAYITGKDKTSRGSTCEYGGSTDQNFDDALANALFILAGRLASKSFRAIDEEYRELKHDPGILRLAKQEETSWKSKDGQWLLTIKKNK